MWKAQAEHAEQQARQALHELGQDFPTYTVSGMVRALLQPWHWSRWCWNYIGLLPQFVQRFLNTIAARQRATWHEANWHLLRQAHLAMAQDVRQQLSALDALEKHLTTLAVQLTTQAEQQKKQLPAPLHCERVHHLWAKITGIDQAKVNGDALLLQFLHQVPLAQWTQSSVAELSNHLSAWSNSLLTALDHWSAVECLTMAFCADQQMPLPAPGGAPTITGQHQPALFAWLDEFMHQAMPLWPNEETAMDTQERWLLTPPSKPAATLSNRQSAPWIDGTEMIDAWAALQPNLLRSSSQVDAIMVLRWVALEEVDQDESW